MGIPVDDPDAHYLYEARMATLWPFDADGKVLGEDTYTGGDGFAGIADRKLDEADIVEFHEVDSCHTPDVDSVYFLHTTSPFHSEARGGCCGDRRGHVGAGARCRRCRW